jgi:hypothetical protein
MNLDIDTSIRFKDGQEAGRIARVVLGPDGKEVESVVMTTSELISRDVVIPIEQLSMAEGDVVELDADPDAIAGLPDYREEQLAVDPAEWTSPNAYAPGMANAAFPASEMTPILPRVEYENVPEGSISVSQGTRVMCVDGSVGVVDEVVSDEQGQLLAFIVRPDDEGAPDFRVPMELVYRSAEDLVYLNCKRAALPDYVEPLIEENEEPEPRPLL